MIERYVFIKFKPEHATTTERAAAAAHTRDVLSSLPGVVSLTVGTPADKLSEKSWDLSIVVRFDHIDDIEPYRVHPTHRAYVDDYLAPKMEVIKAWNFEVGS